MARESFVIPFADLERGPKTASFSISEDWLRNALEGTEAEPAGGEGSLDVEVMKNGAEVMVRGTAAVSVVLPCSKTLDPVRYAIQPSIFLMLSPASPAAPPQRRPRNRRKQGGPQAQRANRPRSAKQGAGVWREDPALSAETAARDTFDGEQIKLDPFVREFILLDLPMVPLREDLRSEDFAASSAPPEADASDKPVDPRLMPLKELMQRMRHDKE